MDANAAYDELVGRSKQIADIYSALALLNWDQRTMIPPGGHAARAGQIETLAGLAHDMFTAPEFAELLEDANKGSFMRERNCAQQVNVREWRRDYEREAKVPGSLARALAKCAAEAQTVWEKARGENDWKSFEPHLNELVRLNREKAAALGFEREAYDALLDAYEPGMCAGMIEPLFNELTRHIKNLLDEVREADKKAVDLEGVYAPEAQLEFARLVLAKMGVDFTRTRMDLSAHPFSTLICPGDVRITTRFSETNPFPSFFAAVHEAGHALYSLGLPAEYHGTPMGEAVSVGVHESQSRMWENQVARTEAFWRYFHPMAQECFDPLAKVGLDEFVFAVNKVEPGLIRVEADEVTYHLHVQVRFDLERALINGEMEAGDLPAAFDEAMAEHLGLTPPDFATGVMQDVHWAAGLFGYFPTYSLGNLYAAQMYGSAKDDLGDLDAMYARGEFGPLLKWLGAKVHSQGRRFNPGKLIREISVAAPTPGPLMAHLSAKVDRFYG